MIKRLLILLSYAVVAVAVLITTIILVELGQGYTYNFKTNQFSINGLLALGTSPSGANLYINNRYTHRKTPYRSTMPTGTYDVELRADGYRTWRKQIDILPYQVTILNSIFLLPNTITPIRVTPNQTVSGLIASTDRKHFAYFTPEPAPALWVLNPDSKQGTKIYTPKTASADHPAEQMLDATWSDDNSHMLVRSTIGAATVYNLVSASGGSPTDLTSVFKFDLTGLRFSSYDWHELYWNSPEGLRKINVNDRTVSAVLASQVSNFTFAGNNRIIYVQTTPQGKSVWSMDHNGNNAKRLIESLSESGSYELIYANHNRDMLAVLPQSSATATLYLDIFSSTPTSKVIAHGVSHISFSDDGRYLAFYNGDGFGTYDVERNMLTSAKQGSNSLSCLTWFDPAHVVICRNGEADLVELDGSNLTTIAPIVSGTTAYGSFDQRFIYTVSNISGQPASVYSSQVRK